MEKLRTLLAANANLGLTDSSVLAHLSRAFDAARRHGVAACLDPDEVSAVQPHTPNTKSTTECSPTDLRARRGQEGQMEQLEGVLAEYYLRQQEQGLSETVESDATGLLGLRHLKHQASSLPG